MSTSPPKLTDRELRASEARYRRLFESGRDGILLLNAETAQIEDVNPFLIDLLGYTHAEFLGKTLWEVGPFADRSESKEMFTELQANGYVRYEHLPLRTKAGVPVSVEFISNVYDCDGISVIQCNIRDITDRRALEATLAVAHAQMITSSRLSAIGEMAGGIAHEINNPLAVIHALASDMIEQENISSADCVHSASRIVDYADRIARIVVSLRHLSRADVGDTFAIVPIHLIVEQSLALCGERFRLAGVNLIISSIDPQMTVLCRPLEISRVIINLLQNAFDAVERAPGSRWVRLDVMTVEHRLILSVTDNGAGVPLELRGQIMEPFFTTKPVGQGTGLGLSLSRQIADEHGGSLLLSEVNRHTCFCLNLPFSSDER